MASFTLPIGMGRFRSRRCNAKGSSADSSWSTPPHALADTESSTPRAGEDEPAATARWASEGSCPVARDTARSSPQILRGKAGNLAPSFTALDLVS